MPRLASNAREKGRLNFLSSVKMHPLTGRKCLFVNEGFTAAIEGMPEDESRALLRELFDHTTRPEFVYRHHWRVGDLVMWDNYATVHRGAGGYSAEERRLMHRTTLKGQQRRPAAA